MPLFRMVLVFFACLSTLLVLTPHERTRKDLPITIYVAIFSAFCWTLALGLP